MIDIFDQETEKLDRKLATKNERKNDKSNDDNNASLIDQPSGNTTFSPSLVTKEIKLEPSSSTNGNSNLMMYKHLYHG